MSNKNGPFQNRIVFRFLFWIVLLRRASAFTSVSSKFVPGLSQQSVMVSLICLGSTQVPAASELTYRIALQDLSVMFCCIIHDPTRYEDDRKKSELLPVCRKVETIAVQLHPFVIFRLMLH